MKILVVGGAGTIGRAIVDELAPRHEVLIAGRSSGDVKIDMTDPETIRAAYKETVRWTPSSRPRGM